MKRTIRSRAKNTIEFRRARKQVKEMLAKKNGPIMLNMGCGTDYKKGWINIDNNSDHNIKKLDLNWDLTKPLPFDNESVDFIFNEHFIEHLTAEEGVASMRDCMRVLKPGGVLRMATPDLAVMIDKYKNVPISKDKSIKRFKLDFIKTKAERINVGFRNWGHKWIYDWEELERRIKEAGFSKIEQAKKDKSKHKQLNRLETREESTLVAEATK